MMYRQGDILLIPVPFTDLSSSKRRPVLVISNNLYNSPSDDMVVVAITSNLASKSHSILIKSDSLLEGVLKVDSNIRTDKIYTLSQNIVMKKFGTVKEDVLYDVIVEIGKLIKRG
ncbi:PemK-like protein [Andreesenia angusta]|uniref:PemK-like protein n=1 Tax=Andreesenia angusta TaxID=39480 RepID=A0A1S1V9U5_9FIRM|nr:type II toxin-antitoxin system PemK/MazF family toxin [Andreesenia angusta]OHW63391.1 PemK-like protein [Andreesenia angusta]